MNAKGLSPHYRHAFETAAKVTPHVARLIEARRAVPRKPLWDRLWAKVAIPFDHPNVQQQCWLWTGAKSVKRAGLYGAIQTGGRGSPIVAVHRQILVWFKGLPPTPDHEGGHTCPVPNTLCCNPAHLDWQTREENELTKVTARSQSVRLRLLRTPRRHARRS